MSVFLYCGGHHDSDRTAVLVWSPRLKLLYCKYHQFMYTLPNKDFLPSFLPSFLNSFLHLQGEHAENEHWRLVEDINGQVGYAPAAFLMVILDTTAEEEESSATKKGQENSTEENQIGGWVGQEGERSKDELLSGSDRWHQEKL